MADYSQPITLYDNGGDVYGGSGWFQQALQAAIQQALLQMQQNDQTGYWYEGYQQERPEPTENDALDAIWANRPDIQAFYDQNWGAGQYNPREAVKNWLSISDEAGGQNALDFALEQGWVQPGQAGSEGTKTPTMAREQFDANTAYQNKMLELQEAQMEQAERLNISNQEFQQMLKEMDHAVQLQMHGETMAFEREKQAFLERHSLDVFEWDKLMDTKNLELETRKLELSEKLTDAQIQDMHDRLGFDYYQTDLDAELKREAMAMDDAKWRAELGLEERKFESSEELAKQGLGLDYLKLLGSLTGPQDYFRYHQVKRAAGDSPLPAWAQALSAGQALAPFQGAQGQMQGWTDPAQLNAPAQNTWLDNMIGEAVADVQQNPQAYSQGAPQMPTGEMAAQGQPVQGQAAQQQQAGTGVGAPAWMVNPQLVRPDQWQSMMPSEQKMLLGAIGYMGGDPEDWLAQMQKAAPTGQAQAVSMFSGW